MNIQPYDPDRHEAHVHRLLKEVGWENESNAQAHAAWLGAGHVLVAELRGEAEAFSAAFDGHVRHLRQDLPLVVVGAVATSRVGRHQGLASALSARSVADGVQRGAHIAGLGVFDQGFYERLGLAPSARLVKVGLDPAHLVLPATRRSPVRLGTGDYERIHASRLARRPVHGMVGIDHARYTLGDALFSSNGFGLGFEDEQGELTHHLWLSTEDPGHGPYTVVWSAWRTHSQLHELLGLLEALSDQVHTVVFKEPVGVRLEELVHRPFRTRQARKGSAQAAIHEEWSYQQLRICDLPATLRSTRMPGPGSVRFVLELSDPIDRFLPEGSPWRGIAGEYTLTLGPECEARPGAEAGLPRMACGVGTFTQLWLGVAAPSHLPLSRLDLEADEGLLEALDEVVRLPAPSHDWDF